MPPRLQVPLTILNLSSAITPAIYPFLLPFLHTQHRAASILNSLRDVPGAYNPKKRLGRGPSSGKGKTSGRGHKGQKAHGKVPRNLDGEIWNGGQTPMKITHGLPKGFVNYFTESLTPLNLDKLQTWLYTSRIDPTQPITVRELALSRCCTNITDGIKLLARTRTPFTFPHPINIIVSRASSAAIAAVEAAGGTVTTRYYTPFAIQRILRGKTDPMNSLQSRLEFEGRSGEGGVQKEWLNRLPDPTSRKEIEYYRDPEHRGYLSYTVGTKEGPSLFHRNPDFVKKVVRRRVKGPTAAENRIW